MGNIAVNISCLVGINIVRILYCRLSVVGIGLDSDICVSGVNMLRFHPIGTS